MVDAIHNKDICGYNNHAICDRQIIYAIIWKGNIRMKCANIHCNNTLMISSTGKYPKNGKCYDCRKKNLYKKPKVLNNIYRKEVAK